MDAPLQFLAIINGTGKSERYVLKNPTLIGRSDQNDIRLIDQKVSRLHARIELVDESWQIIDADSSNGTRLNGLPIKSTALQHGDHISIGNTVFRFEDQGVGSKTQTKSVDIRLHESSEFIEDIVESVSVSDDFSSFLKSNEPEAIKLQKALKDLTVFYRAAIISNKAENVEQMVTQVLEYLFDWIGADRGCIFLFDKQSDHLTPVASRLSKEIQSDSSLHISRTILNYSISTNNGILTNNAGGDTRFESAHSVVHYGIQSAICTPMKGRYGVIGCIYFDILDSTQKEPATIAFTEMHLRFLVAIANQVAIAIEDTRFYHDLIVDERVKAMGEAVGRVAHELRNVLHGIHASFANLESHIEYLRDQNATDTCTNMGRRIDRLSSLVREMLAFIKTEKPAQKDIDLFAVVEETVSDATAIARGRNCQLNKELNSTNATIIGNQESIQQVIENLIINAIDACSSEKMPCVTVCLDQTDQSNGFEISVTDNGPGVPHELKDRIFDAFFTTKDVGIGLGLANAKKIVNEHGGTIELTKHERCGAQFTVILPTPPTATWSGNQ